MDSNGLWLIRLIMGILGFTGLLGNSFVIMFYSRCKRSSAVHFITCLTCSDLFVCIHILPKLLELSMLTEHKYSVLCKVLHSTANWAIICSCWFMLPIAIDRWRRICKPFKKQLTIEKSRYVSMLVVIVGMFMGLKHIFLTDTVVVKIHDLAKNSTTIGLYCTTSSEYALATAIFNSLDVSFAFALWISAIWTHSQIVRKLFTLQQKRKNRKERCKLFSKPREKYYGQDVIVTARKSSINTLPMRRVTGPKPHQIKRYFSDQDIPRIVSDEHIDSRTNRSVSISNLKEQDLRRNHEQLKASAETAIAYSVSEDCITSIQSCNSEQTTRMELKRSRTVKKSRTAEEIRITLMLLSATVLVIIMFAPYLVIKIVFRQILKVGPEFEIRPSVQFALNLVYLNSAVTPVVYLIFNRKFRSFVANFCRTKARKFFSS